MVLRVREGKVAERAEQLFRSLTKHPCARGLGGGGCR